MADVIYNSFKSDLMKGAIDLDTNSFKCMLVTSAYTPNQDTHTTKANVTNEVSGTGYTARGVALSGLAVTTDNTGNRGLWDFNDPTWAASTITARGAVFYKDTGTDATDLLIAYIDFGSDKSSSAGTFQLAIDPNGFMALT